MRVMPFANSTKEIFKTNTLMKGYDLQDQIYREIAEFSSSMLVWTTFESLFPLDIHHLVGRIGDSKTLRSLQLTMMFLGG